MHTHQQQVARRLEVVVGLRRRLPRGVLRDERLALAELLCLLWWVDGWTGGSGVGLCWWISQSSLPSTRASKRTDARTLEVGGLALGELELVQLLHLLHGGHRVARRHLERGEVLAEEGLDGLSRLCVVSCFV